jgi:hypothetical protein
LIEEWKQRPAHWVKPFKARSDIPVEALAGVDPDAIKITLSDRIRKELQARRFREGVKVTREPLQEALASKPEFFVSFLVMVMEPSSQRIARLTPLCDVLALIESGVGSVATRKCALPDAEGATLVEDIVVERPARATALRDGFAVVAADLVDAGSYSPVPFASMPYRVDVGDTLPEGTDAVALLDGVASRGKSAEAIAPVTPGEGVLLAGGDASCRVPLRRAGERLRQLDIAALAVVGISEVIIRSPRIVIGCGSATRN